MKAIGRFLTIILLSLVFASPGNINARADRLGRWVPDQQIPGYLDDTFTPFLVADHNRTVHAFVSQWVQDGSRRQAIVYRQWTLRGGWTRPVDILLAPSGDAQILGAFLDASDHLHIIFRMGKDYEAAVYHSSALAVSADSAAAWSLPEMVGYGLGLNSAAITGDDQGNLVVIYSGNMDGIGVYSTTSGDWGSTWSQPTPIYLTYDKDLIPFSLRLFMGPDQQVRAAWSVVTSLGVDKLLFFANYDISKAKWSDPKELDRKVEIVDYFGPSYPAMVDTGREIVIMYNSGNTVEGRPVNLGRPIQQVLISSDNGVEWNGPLAPFPFHLGRSGEHALVEDGSGVPQALFIQRIENTDDQGKYTAIGGIWHSAYEDGSWTNPERYVTTITPHDIRAVVSQGNVLLAVWREDPGIGQHGLWFSYTVLDSPEQPVVPLQTAQAVVSIQPSPTAIPVMNTPTPLAKSLLEDTSKPWSNNPAFPLIVGILPVVLIVIGLLAASRFMTEHR